MEAVSLPRLDNAALRIANSGSNTAATDIALPAMAAAQQLTVEDLPQLRDLDGFGGLRKVHRSFTLRDLPGLSDLAGLGALRSVSGALGIYELPALEALDQLSMLEDAGRLMVSQNAALVTIELPTLGVATLSIDNNRLLRSVAAPVLARTTTLLIQANGQAGGDLSLSFPALKRMEGDTWINRNGGIADLTAFAGVEAASDVVVRENSDLTSVAGLTAVPQLNSLTVSENPRLSALNLPNLTTLPGGLTVNDNAVLTQVNLPQPRAIAKFEVTGNPRLARLEAAQVVEVIGNVDIRGNGESQTALVVDLRRLTEIGGNLNINQNQGLVSAGDFTALTRVAGQVQVQQNPRLTSLSGLSALADIGDGLSLFANASLTDVSGLSGLRTLMGGLTVSGSSMLAPIQLPQLAVFSGTISVSGNARLVECRFDGITAATSVTLRQNGSFATSALVPSMSSLSTVTNGLVLISIGNLTSLAGFPAVTSLGSLEVASNSDLPTCEAVALRDRIVAGGGISGAVAIQNNQADACSP